MADSFRNSNELSFNEGDIKPEEFLNGRNPVLARSFEEGIRDSYHGGMNGVANDSAQILQSEGSQKPSIKGGQTIELGFNDLGSSKMQSLFYEPNISKPIRGTKNVTITINKNGVLEGIPTAWRQVLDMPP